MSDDDLLAAEQKDWFPNEDEDEDYDDRYSSRIEDSVTDHIDYQPIERAISDSDITWSNHLPNGPVSIVLDDIQRFRKGAFLLVEFICNWAKKSQIEPSVVKDFNYPIAMSFLRYLRRNSPEAKLSNLFAAVPKETQPILGRRDVAANDLLSCPLWPSSHNLWGAYMDIVTSSNKSLPGTSPDGLYVGSSCNGSGGVLTRISQHEYCIGKNFESLPAYRQSRHARALCQPECRS